MINTQYIRPTTCIDANQKLLKYCVPELVSCPPHPKEGLFVDCDKKWNCNIPCQKDRKYGIPFLKGDIIQLQTLFYSGNPSSPTPYDDLISIELCSNNGGDFEPIRKMSAWKNKRPYQIIEIDTNDMPDCFSLEFTNLATGEKCCTQEWECIGEIIKKCCGLVNTDRNGINNTVSSSDFQFADISADSYLDFVANIESAGGTVELTCLNRECHQSKLCITGIEGDLFSYVSDGETIEIEMTCKEINNCTKNTVLIQSKRSSPDCFGYCYGKPDSFVGDEIEYNNQIRLCGSIGESGFTNSVARIDKNGISSEEIRTGYRLNLIRKMPPFIKDIVKNQLITGGEVCINGEDYLSDGVEIGPESRYANMWSFGVDLYRCCTISNDNCR